MNPPTDGIPRAPWAAAAIEATRPGHAHFHPAGWFARVAPASLMARLVIGVGVTLLALGGVAGWLLLDRALQQENRAYEEQVRAVTAGVAHVTAQQMAIGDPAVPETVVRDTLRNAGVRAAWIYDPEERILAEAHDTARGVGWSRRAGDLILPQARAGHYQREGDGALVAQALVAGERVGWLAIEFDARDLIARERALRAFVFGTVLMVAGVGCGVLAIFLWFPLRALRLSGDYAASLVTRSAAEPSAVEGATTRPPPGGSREIARLWAALDKSSRELKRQRMAEQHARRELSDYKHALDQHALVSMSDDRGDIVAVNDLFCRAVGHKCHELIGRNHRILKSSHHPPEFYEQMWSAIASGRTWHGVICSRVGNDDERWFSSTIVPMMDEGYSDHDLDHHHHAHAHPHGYIAIRTDITAQKHAEEAALYAARLKARMVAVLSHELRTPMTGLIGALSLMRASGLTPAQSRGLDLAMTTAGHMMELMNATLDFARLESGRTEWESAPFDPRAWAEETLGLRQAVAESRGITLSLDVADGVPAAVVGDVTRLRQVLGNLLDNALKFTEQGGIRVRLATVEREGASWLRVEVEDTGPGLTAGEQARIFEPFVQAGPEIRRLYGGTGLGLAICHGIVEGLGGEIGVRSVKGQGTTFWFEVPSGKD